MVLAWLHGCCLIWLLGQAQARHSCIRVCEFAWPAWDVISLHFVASVLPADWWMLYLVCTTVLVPGNPELILQLPTAMACSRKDSHVHGDCVCSGLC